MSSGHSAGQEKIERDGYRWFFLMGAIALLLCFWLKSMDDYLSFSDREQRLGATLKELRTAQTTLPGRVTDERQTSPFLFRAAPVVEEEGHAASHGH